MLSALQSDSHRKETTTLIMLLHHILQTPTFMHHLGSTLSLRCFVSWDYEGKSEPNISCWQKYSAHTKVYIFQLKNNYSSSNPCVFACFVVLTKRGGTIHHYEWKESLYFQCISAYSATVSTAGSLAFRRWWFAVYDLWFFVLGKQIFPACEYISLLSWY